MFGEKRPWPLSWRALIRPIAVSVMLLIVACASTERSQTETPPGSATVLPTTSALFADPRVSTGALPTATESEPTATALAATPVVTPTSADILLDLSAEPMPIDRRVLGTNLPAWLGAGRGEDATFIARTIAAGVTLVRIPGGSWSNGYNWLACETGVDIEGNSDACWSWPWGLRPTDFINFIKATGTEAVYTVNHNGTAKEAAALVAFFNGAVDDETEIGVDVWGRDWGTAGDWAKLRRDNGNPEPLPVRYWEIGNEIYGGREGMGTDCSPWGWEDVWTCDGREYVNGIGSGGERHEGFLEFRTEMQKVDPTILVGAVGLTPQSEWSNWGNEVIEEAGEAMDFYVIHHYAFFDPPASLAEALARPQADWQSIMAEAQAAFDAYDDGRSIPIAITEYNLFAFQDMDSEQLMTRSVNLLFIADTIGQMLQNGVSLANQWDLANGQANNGTDYGLLNADTFDRSPQYYAFPLWAAFGETMLPVDATYDPAAELSVYAGWAGTTTVSLLAINKTDVPITAGIQLVGLASSPLGVTANVAAAASFEAQTVTFNGVSDPADDLSDAPPETLSEPQNPFSYTFVPYSITLLQIMIDSP